MDAMGLGCYGSPARPPQVQFYDRLLPQVKMHAARPMVEQFSRKYGSDEQGMKSVAHDPSPRIPKSSPTIRPG